MRKNAFDSALGTVDDEGLNGIGSELKKVGRKIDHVGRKIRDSSPLTVKLHAELKRFLATDIGKVIAVVVAVVAAIYMGPAALELLKVAVSKAGAFVKLAAKKAAAYVAKQGAKKLIVKEIKSKAISLVAEKAGKKYAEHKVRGMEKEAARELAIYEKELENKVFMEMEAEFLKQSGQTLSAVENEQFLARQRAIPKGPTGKVIPLGFKFSKRMPNLGDYWRGNNSRSSSGPPDSIIKELTKNLNAWKVEYDAARAEYMEKNPALGKTKMDEVLAGIDALGANVQKVEQSTAFQTVKRNLSSQGVTAAAIRKEWETSKTYKEVTRNSVVESFAPIMQRDMMNRGVPVQEAEIIAIGATAQMGEKIAGGSSPFLLIGGIAATLFMLI